MRIQGESEDEHNQDRDIQLKCTSVDPVSKYVTDEESISVEDDQIYDAHTNENDPEKKDEHMLILSNM